MISMNRFRTGALPLVAVTSLCLALSACTASTSSNSSARATPVAETSAPPIPAGLESFYGQKIDWSACEDEASFQCATAQVPLDYANPTGQTIDIALKKLPSTSGEPIGTLFVNPGGPGGSGVEHVSAGEAAFSADLRSNFDIIGFDPRGVGASAPLTCLSPEEIDQAAKAATGQAASSADDSASKRNKEESVQASIQDGQETAAKCEQNSSVPGIIDHMDTASVVQDLDILRATSGDPRLYFMGASYGTYLGARYAEMFPANVGRMVLDSAQDPSLQNAQIGLDQAAAIEGSVRTYVEHCQAGEDCPLTGTPDEGLSQLRALIDNANVTPLPTSQEGVTVDGATISSTLVQLMYDDSTWDTLTSALRAAMRNNDGTELSALATAAEGGGDAEQDPEKAAQAQAQKAANESAMSAIDCLDYPVRGDQAQWDEQAATIKETAPTVGQGLGYRDAFCQGWGHSTDHEPAAVRAEGSAPILVVGITGDPATPYHWSQALASQLESGRLLTVEGNGHGAYRLKGACVDNAVDSYLLRGELPDEGTTCKAEPAAAAATTTG